MTARLAAREAGGLGGVGGLVDVGVHGVASFLLGVAHLWARVLAQWCVCLPRVSGLFFRGVRRRAGIGLSCFV